MNSLRIKLANKIRETNFVVYENQKCPNTFIEIKALGFSGVGFSKVSWPDEWDEEFGMDLAYNKAVYDITRQILKSDLVETYLERLEIEK